MKNQQVFVVQLLRAVAATEICILHFSHEVADRFPSAKAIHDCFQWNSGVDLFFVISGFVIFLSSEQHMGEKKERGNFIKKRLLRIAPMYWLATTALVLVAALNRTAVKDDIGGFFFILCSYFFIPATRPNGEIQPSLKAGWTLNFEMMFYMLFSVFLPLKRRQVAGAVIVCLLAIALAGSFGVVYPLPFRFYCDSIVAEFAFGVALAAFFFGRVTLSLYTSIILAVVAIAALIMDGTQYGVPRVLAGGIPCFMLMIAGTLGGAEFPEGQVKRLLTLLGDASYVLYLIHPFAMRVFGKVVHAINMSDRQFWGIAFPVAIVCVLMSASALHLWVERPMQRFLKRRMGVGQQREMFGAKAALPAPERPIEIGNSES